MVTKQNAFTLRDFRNTRIRQSGHKLVTGNRNTTSLTRKDHEVVAEAKRYSLDIVGISSTEHRGSNTAKLDDRWWKLFYSVAEPAKLARVDWVCSGLLQPLRWRCVECAIHHERDVREE